jgi:hypothetical protein
VDRRLVTYVRAASARTLALAATLLAFAGCDNLPTVDPGPRWIDQFSDDAGVPSWNAFGTWTCGTEPVPSTAATSDGGGADAGLGDAAPADAASADAALADAGAGGGPGMPCQMGPGDGDAHGLDQPFAFPDTSNDTEFTVTTQATSGTVDFTGFHTFVFDAWLRGPATAPLPAGTVFRVELRCSKNQGEKLLAQNVSDILTNAQTWDTSHRPLAQFLFMLSSSTASCLSQIDEIRFVVRPGQNNEPEVVGTLSLDSVRLEN